MMNTQLPFGNHALIQCGGLLWVENLDVRGSE
jgi:hypothetical protein